MRRVAVLSLNYSSLRSVYPLCRATFVLFKKLLKFNPLSCRSRRKRILSLSLFVEVGRSTHHCSLKQWQQTFRPNKLYKSKNEISFESKAYPPVVSSRDVGGPLSQSGVVSEEKCGIIFPPSDDKQSPSWFCLLERSMELSFSLEMILLFEPFKVRWGLESF